MEDEVSVEVLGTVGGGIGSGTGRGVSVGSGFAQKCAALIGVT